MKKSIFLIAAMAGALFTACTSEENLTLDNPGKQASANVAVGFDTYLNQATQTQTRAGLQDVMTNAKLQKAQADEGGFGVFAVQHNATTTNQWKDIAGVHTGDWETAVANNTVAPDFMWNQGVFYSVSAWGYTPLKYWPNETHNDSQPDDPQGPAYSQTGTGTTRDRISFFAYAPYVNFTAGTGGAAYTGNSHAPAAGYVAVNNYSPANGDPAVNTGSEGTPKTGIMAVTGNKFATDAPKVYYTIEQTKPEKSVDLLWGVAPAGGLNYTAVNKEAVSVAEGMPLYNLEKPSENEKVKFSFQHALSRISLSIVAALDQIGPGGEFEDGPTTKITVEQVRVKANKFNTAGWLDLNNKRKNRALWEYDGASPAQSDNSTDGWLFTMQNGTMSKENGAQDASDDATGNKLLNTSIWDMGADIATQTEGVTTSEKPLMAPIVNPDKKVAAAASTQTFSFGTSLWTDTDGNAEELEASNSADIALNTIFTGDASKYVAVPATTSPNFKLKGSSKSANYFTITPGSAVAASGLLDNDADYYVKSTDGSSNITYTLYHTGTGEIADAADKFFLKSGFTATNKPASEIVTYGSTNPYYTGTLPRYWMVIPAFYDYSTETVQSTDVTVEITYYVTTHDANLAFKGESDRNYSRVQNIITKTVPVAFESGKSYNLKLILGLTSVKLNAEVADWKLAGDTDVNLPQNVE